MAKNNESTMKWKVDISQLKSAMQDAKRSISLASAEFKTATASLDKWQKSTTGLEAKIKQLNSTLPQQKKILADLEKQYELTAKNMGENSAEAQRLKIQIENQRGVVAKTEASISKYNSQLAQMKAEEEASNTATAKLNKTIQDQESKLRELKTAYQNAVIEYGKNSKEAKNLASQIESLSGELADNKKKMDDAEKSADKLDKTIEDAGKSAEDAAKGGFTVLKGVMANLVTKGIEKAVEGLKMLTDQVIDLGKQSIANYAEYEQLVGGVETLFKDSAGIVEDFADNAFKTAGMSANKYMETVTSFSASLLQGLGGDTEKAAKIADLAITDMSDNANKMGTDMSMIQNAYQGFAKQNFTMLDNLKLGYGGTQTEMVRLINDSGILEKKIKKIDEVTFDQMIMAIHAIQDEMGITGTTAKEAAETIEGSKNSMVASWSNLLTEIAKSDGDIEAAFDKFAESAMAYLDNLLPRVKTLMNNVGKFIRKKLKQIAPEFLVFVDDVKKELNKIIPVVKKLFEFIIKNSRSVITTLKAIATAFVTYKAVSTISNVTTAFSNLFKAVKSGDAIMKAFNTTMGANPYALIAAGIAGLIVLMVRYAKKQQESIEAEYGLSEAQKESVERMNELTESYQELANQRDQELIGIQSEFGYLNELKDEYNGLIDSNGKVKEGYEDRANFILTKLAEAMGIELDQVKELIDGNGKLSDSIDEVIRKKQAEATLLANEELYNEAITNRSEAVNRLVELQKAQTEAQKKYNETLVDYNEVWAEYQRRVDNYDDTANDYLESNAKVIQGHLEAKQALEEVDEEFSKAKETWIGYNTTIQNYEGLSSAIISGDSEKINEALVKMQYNFITAENGTRESLERQVANYQTNLDNLETAIKDGTPGVTQEMVNQAKSMVDAAEKELNKLPPEASAIGIKSGDDYATAIGSTKDKSKSKATEVANAAKEGAESVDSEPSGSKFGEGFFNGIGSWLNSVWERGKELAKKALAGLKKGQEEGSPSKLTRKSGVFFGEGYELGIEDMIDPVAKAASSLAKAAVNALDTDMNYEMHLLGVDSGNSLINGLNSVMPNLKRSIGEVKSSVASANFSMSNGAGYGISASGITNENKTQNVTFNQYNTSPKALDRLSIYRDTNSLLFSAKVRMSNV